MLTIRLQRAGKRNSPQYKVVLAQKTAANQKQFVEILGAYNPHTKELIVRDNERLNYWMNEQHVELSSTIHNLFITKELIKGDKKRAFAVPKKEEVKEEAPAAEASAEPAEATETPSEEPAAIPEEVPATEAPVETSAEAPAEAPVEQPAAEPVTEPAPEEAPAEEKAE